MILAIIARLNLLLVPTRKIVTSPTTISHDGLTVEIFEMSPKMYEAAQKVRQIANGNSLPFGSLLQCKFDAESADVIYVMLLTEFECKNIIMSFVWISIIQKHMHIIEQIWIWIFSIYTVYEVES